MGLDADADFLILIRQPVGGVRDGSLVAAGWIMSRGQGNTAVVLL